MRIKKLLIQFEYDHIQTRWLYRDADLAHYVEVLMKTAAEAHTAGPVPAVTVIEEEETESSTPHDEHA
jgi:hypothetical protein